MSSGGRPRSVSDDEVVRYLRESDKRVLTTAEVANGLDVSHRTALRRLSSLADEGRINRKYVGKRSAVWWATDEEPAAPAAPLRQLVGALDADAADEARARSQAWREAFDEEMAPDGA